MKLFHSTGAKGTPKDILNAPIYGRGGMTLLHVMAQHGHAHLFDSAIKPEKQKVKPNVFDSFDQTPLQIALNEKNMDIAERLLREFRDTIEFAVAPPRPKEEGSPNKPVAKATEHPLAICIKKGHLDFA